MGRGDFSVELDAIPPDTLRALVRTCMEQHLPRRELKCLRQIEKAERESLLEFAAAWRAAEDDG